MTDMNKRFHGVLVDSSVITRITASATFPADAAVSYAVLPGFCDVHVHFREPGFS